MGDDNEDRYPTVEVEDEDEVSAVIGKNEDRTADVVGGAEAVFLCVVRLKMDRLTIVIVCGERQS